MSAALDRIEPGLGRPEAPARAPGPVALIELLDRDGGVAHRVAVQRWPASLGRAIDCDVILDDAHAAAHHASLEWPEDSTTPWLAVGDSLNGARLRGRLLPAGTRVALPGGSEWQLGRTRLRLRLAGEHLAPEQALGAAPQGRGRRTAAGLVLLMGWLAAEHWIRTDPGAPLAGYVPATLVEPVGLCLWAFLWATGSKLFTRHFDFVAHLHWAVGLTLALTVLGGVLPLAGYALSWPWVGRAAELVPLALVCLLLWGQLGLILPTRRRALAVGFATMFVCGATLALVQTHQRAERWFEPLYHATLGPPWLRLAPAASVEDFLDEARGLRAPLAEAARKAARGAAAEDEE